QMQLTQEISKPKYIGYTLDLEEDHAGLLSDYYEGLNHLEEFIHIIKEKEIKLSFFVQAKILEKFPEKIELIRDNNFEIHLHSYSHSLQMMLDKKDTHEEIERCKEIYHDFFGEFPKGYRFPLGVLNQNEYFILNKLGFKFDSSIFPTYRPGFFNNLSMPIKPYRVNGIIEIPFSPISKIIRVPISLSYMKIFYPLHFLKSYSISPLIFDFHFHDLYNLSSTQKLTFIRKLPYIRKSKKGLNIFLKFHEKLMIKGYETVSIYEIYKKIINGEI
ncbi:MAG: polysaccharide deacetylase family protein, partial [Promethearchaeota archaeon]